MYTNSKEINEICEAIANAALRGDLFAVEQTVKALNSVRRAEANLAKALNCAIGREAA